jgi:hypothetical protein
MRQNLSCCRLRDPVCRHSYFDLGLLPIEFVYASHQLWTPYKFVVDALISFHLIAFLIVRPNGATISLLDQPILVWLGDIFIQLLLLCDVSADRHGLASPRRRASFVAHKRPCCHSCDPCREVKLRRYFASPRSLFVRAHRNARHQNRGLLVKAD